MNHSSTVLKRDGRPFSPVDNVTNGTQAAKFSPMDIVQVEKMEEPIQNIESSQGERMGKQEKASTKKKSKKPLLH